LTLIVNNINKMDNSNDFYGKLMKVVCVKIPILSFNTKDVFWENFTIGKSYKYIDKNQRHRVGVFFPFDVQNDDDKFIALTYVEFSKCFKSIDVLREEKLNEILK
jgi:hypothetical protein